MVTRRFCVLAALPAAMVITTMGHAQAQVPRDKGPLRLVVGFPAGGSADALARTIADRLKAELGIPVIVDNRAGAGGQIAADFAKGQAGDGLTVLLGTSHMMVMAPLTTKTVRYDGLRDFKPVARLSSFYEAIAVPIASPANNLDEWLRLARSDAKYASYGVPAPGSLPQFIGYRLGEVTGTKLLPVPYRGAAPLAVDLIAGTLAAGIVPIADLVQHHGVRVKILAVNGAQRCPQLPNVPTLKELGYSQFDQLEWSGLFVPAATADATVGELAAAVLKIAATSDVREALQRLGAEPDPGPGSALTRSISDGLAFWGPVVKASGFSAD